MSPILTKEQTEYENLKKKVNEIDQDAGCYLHSIAPTHLEFQPSGALNLCFIWSESPQGHDFWDQIAAKLGQKEWVQPHGTLHRLAKS